MHSFEFHCTDGIEGLLNSQYSRKQLASTSVVSCILELNNMVEGERERTKVKKKEAKLTAGKKIIPISHQDKQLVKPNA